MSWAMGAAAIVLAVGLERGLARTRYLALLALTLAGCATALYMIRSISSVAPLALLGGVWAVARLRRACGERELLAVVAIFLGLAPFTPCRGFWRFRSPTIPPKRSGAPQPPPASRPTPSRLCKACPQVRSWRCRTSGPSC